MTLLLEVLSTWRVIKVLSKINLLSEKGVLLLDHKIILYHEMLVKFVLAMMYTLVE